MNDNFLETRSIMAVEDHEDAANSTANLLRHYGHRMVVDQTGGAALELAADDPPDVVLLDIRLPDLDSWEVARWLREQARGAQKRPLLVAATGCKSDAEICRSNLAGIDLHLVNSVDPAVLVGLVSRFSRVFALSSPVNASE